MHGSRATSEAEETAPNGRHRSSTARCTSQSSADSVPGRSRTFDRSIPKSAATVLARRSASARVPRLTSSRSLVACAAHCRHNSHSSAGDNRRGKLASALPAYRSISRVNHASIGRMSGVAQTRRPLFSSEAEYASRAAWARWRVGTTTVPPLRMSSLIAVGSLIKATQEVPLGQRLVNYFGAFT